MMSAEHKEAKKCHDSALALDARIADFYNDVVKRSGQITSNPRFSVPIEEFTSLSLRLNEEHGHITECWVWLIQEIFTRLRAAIGDVGSNVYPRSVQPEMAVVLDEHFSALRALFIDDAESDSVGKVMKGRAEKQEAFNIPKMALPDSMIEKVDALLIDMLKAMRTIELELTGKDANKLSGKIEEAIANMRVNGLLPRSFSWDLSGHVRMQVKQTYADLDALLEIPASFRIERADWAGDIMNALTVAIIEIRDSDTHNDHSQMYFEELLCFAQQMGRAAVNYASMNKVDWEDYLKICERTIAGLPLSDEVKGDLLKALKRLHLGNQRDKAQVSAQLDALSDNIKQSGWFNLPYCDTLMMARNRLIHVQNLIGRSLEKKYMHAKAAQASIASAHEAVFSEHLLQGTANTAVNRWCQKKLGEMQALRENSDSQGISSLDVLLFEGKYRSFWGTFINELDERYFEASAILGRRNDYRDARKRTSDALESLANQGEMLFQFKDCKLPALLELLQKNWGNAYRLSPTKQDGQRKTAYETLNSRLQMAQSEAQALHYLTTAAQSMLGAHAQTSVAHNITLWRKPSRGAEAIRQTLCEATRLGLLPGKVTLPFTQTISHLQTTMSRFFSTLWFVDRIKQKHIDEVMTVIAGEREKLLVSSSYKRESAETAVLGAIRRRYEQLKTTHDNRSTTRVLRYMGHACKDNYVETWRAVYTEIARERQLSLVAKPMVLENLKTLVAQYQGLPVATSDDGPKKKQAIDSINKLIESVDKRSFHPKSIYLIIHSRRDEIDRLQYDGMIQAFDETLQQLLRQGFVEKCKPRNQGALGKASEKMASAKRLLGKLEVERGLR